MRRMQKGNYKMKPSLKIKQCAALAEKHGYEIAEFTNNTLTVQKYGGTPETDIDKLRFHFMPICGISFRTGHGKNISMMYVMEV